MGYTLCVLHHALCVVHYAEGGMPRRLVQEMQDIHNACTACAGMCRAAHTVQGE